MPELIQIVSDFYLFVGLEREATAGDVYGIASVLILLGLSLSFILFRKPREIEGTEVVAPEEQEVEHKSEEKPTEPEPVSTDKTPETPTLSWRERLSQGLSRSRQEIWGRLGDILGDKKLDADVLEDVEEILYSADIGPKAVAEIIDGLEERSRDESWGPEQLKAYLRTYIYEKMSPYQAEVPENLYQFSTSKEGQTQVIMVVGVNGAGKTTTIGKLATKLTRQGAKVVVGACDTFRAAAVDQLEIWCQRAGAEMVRAKEGAGPSGVGYQALEMAQKNNADYCILDTAGRLHTKGNLMDELTKSRDVLKKLDPTAPHHTLLVLDAITGQNALRQAEEFHKALNLSGLILTKCDGSSKAGSAVAIVQDLKVPIVYIGVGETVEDLDRFDLESYLDALLGSAEDKSTQGRAESSSIDVSP